MTALRFLDTNILLYSISGAADEAVKRNTAVAVLDGDDNALSVQVLQEFYVQSTRVTRAGALSHETAAALIATWMRFDVKDNTVAVLRGALDIKSRYGFSYWDSAVIAAARALGCSELLSEDLRHGQVIDGMTITNPFRA